MAYTTIVSGTTITSSWANSDVRDQVVVPFASTAARSAAITSPVVGQVSTLTANNTTEGIYQYNSGSQWRAPWNLPWGDVAISAVPGTFNFTTSKGTSSNFTLTTVSNRKLLISYLGEYATNGATGSVATIWLETSGAVSLLNPLQRWTAGGTQQWAANGGGVITSPGTGSQTWRLAAISSLSATSQGVTPTTLNVIDIGPSGAPA